MPWLGIKTGGKNGKGSNYRENHSIQKTVGSGFALQISL
jgi:hypothetical protein